MYIQINIWMDVFLNAQCLFTGDTGDEQLYIKVQILCLRKLQYF